MFFKAIAPACLKGIKFNITIESADEGLMSVGITPTSETGKSGFCLTPRQFVAWPEEFDKEFAGVMGSFAATQMTLSEQLKASELVAQEVAAAAAEAAKSKVAAKPTVTSTYKTKPVKGNQAPAGLLDDDADLDPDAQDGHEEGDEADAGVKSPKEVATSREPASTGALSFNFDM